MPNGEVITKEMVAEFGRKKLPVTPTMVAKKPPPLEEPRLIEEPAEPIAPYPPGLGGYPTSQMLGGPPGVDAWSMLRVFGEGLTMLPEQVAAAFLSASQGLLFEEGTGASVADRDWADRIIKLAKEDQERFIRESLEKYGDKITPEIAQLPQNLAYSITSMGTGVVVGGATGLLTAPAGPAALYLAYASGTAASGVAAYQMTTYQIMQEYLELKDAESWAEKGRGITLEEENQLKKDFQSKAHRYGLWEAVPEALSNLAFVNILTAPLTKMVGGSLAKAILLKIGLLYGEEFLTETITQKGQSAIEVEAGLREERITWAEAFWEIAPQTFLLTTVMGGAGQTIISSVNAIKKIKSSLKAEIGETSPLYEGILDEAIAKYEKAVTPEVLVTEVAKPPVAPPEVPITPPTGVVRPTPEVPIKPPVTPEVTEPLPPGLKKPIESLTTIELEKRVKLATPYKKLYQAELDRRAGVAIPKAVPEVITPKPLVISPAKTRVNEIQEQGRTNPEGVSPEEAKFAHIEKTAPDGASGRRMVFSLKRFRFEPEAVGVQPPRPPSDIIRELADKTPIGERPDQTLLRLHEAAVSALKEQTGVSVLEGDRRLKALGIGVVKRGHLVPKEKDKAILTELYNALHNPSKVATGEITIPKGFEEVYEELRGLADWDTASRIDFDPRATILDDWFFRGWKPPEGMFPDVGKGQLGIQPRALRMPRVDATFEEMLELGFEPLFWNPYQQWGHRHNLGLIYQEQMELIAYLKGMGNEFIRPDSGGALLVGWKIPRVGPAFEGKPFSATDADGNPTVMYTRRWVTPTKIANALENIYGRRPDMGKFIIRGKVIDPLAIIDFFTFVPKRAKLILSLFQQVDFLTRAGGGSWAGMVDSLMAGKPIGAVKSLARYPKTVVDIIHANLSPDKRLSLTKQLNDTTPIIEGRPGIHLKGIKKAGLSTMDVTIFAADMDKMMRIVADQTGIWGKAKGVADSFIDMESAMRRGLFKGVYVAAMITDIRNNIALMMVRAHPNATDAQINAMIAMETNKKYSTIPPSQSVFQNTFLREVLRRMFFSIGESEGLLRQATGMLHGRHKGFWIRNNLGVALFVLAVANIIHWASTGEPLPKERYVPIAKDNWGPLPFGYNTQFASPTLPWRGRGNVELTLDLVGQMDTALRLLDPGSFLTARTSVPIRATINQASGTDFYGAPIDDVGPGGLWSRAVQLGLDLFSPIGVGGIATEAARRAVGGELIPRGETRLGMVGLGLQATGLNLRAEATLPLLNRHARESGFLKADGTKVQNWDDLEPYQKGKVLENQELRDELAIRSGVSVERGYPGAKGFVTLEELDQMKIERGEALVTEFKEGIYDAFTFRGAVSNLKLEIASRKSQVDEDFQLFLDTEELPEDPNKRALVEFYTIFDNAKRLSGVIDWDKVEQLEFQLRAGWTAEQEAYVNRNTGLTKWGPLMQEFVDAQKLLSDSGYWDIQEPNQRERRITFRKAHPEIDALLVHWYGYKPAKPFSPFPKTPSSFITDEMLAEFGR